MSHSSSELQETLPTATPSQTREMSMGRRILPALILLLVAPFIAEFLLGNLPITLFYAYPFLVLLYGGGAVLIREWARRTGRGWPTIILLAIAYAILEEAVVTQSLFNPNYVGLRLLDYGFIPALGIGGPWTLFVLSLHVVWSISVPIALVEAMFPQRRTIPWLRLPGMIVISVVFLLGVAINTFFSLVQYHYVASAAQFIVSGILILACMIAAFVVFRPGAQQDSRVSAQQAPAPLLLAIVLLVLGSLFELVNSIGQNLFPPVLVVVFTLLLDGLAVFLIIAASRRAGWSDKHRFALAAGGLLVYCWWGSALISQRGVVVINLIGQLIWLAIALLLLLYTGYRVYRSKR